MANPKGRWAAGRGAALYVTLAVAFTVIILITAMALFFKISDITVEGAARYSEREILLASGIEEDNSIFFLSSGKAEVAIKSQLPYIDSVKVERRLPGSVVIRVTESVPAAYIPYDGSYWVIDLTGRILEKVSSAPEGLVVISGATPEKPEVGKALTLGSAETVRLTAITETLTALRDNGKLELTTSLDVSNLSAITFEYYGYRVDFGKAGNWDNKFNLLDNFLRDHPERGTGQKVYYNENNGGLYY